MHLIDLTIASRETDLGGFSVHRVLPYAKRRMVGPFIFLDHMGPAHFDVGKGMDVRPHPHIGLATVSYLFDGEIIHRDTLGSQQAIRPGDVNWMTAGRGIAHSERSERHHAQNLHGLQCWVALPKSAEESLPEFFHHAANTLPEFISGAASLKLIAGSAYGYESPVRIHSPLFFIEVKLSVGSRLTLPSEYSERALYLISGQLRAGQDIIESGTMSVFISGDAIVVEALQPSHFMLLGGEPFAEPRYIDWNFVSSSKERIEQAKDDWRRQRFGTIPGDDKEFIPLPEQLREISNG